MLAAAFVADRLAWPRSLAGGTADLLAAWDGNWYRLVAERGYLLTPDVQSDVAFFPALPVLLAAADRLGLPLAETSVVVANAAFLVGMLALYELGRRWLPEDVAKRAAVYAAITPFSFVFSMGYPESFVFAAVALAGLLAVRGRWLSCAAVAAVATLARPQGALVAIPVAAAALGGGLDRTAAGRGLRWTAVLAAPVALAVFSLYLWRTVGDPLAWSSAQELWGREFSPAGPVTALHQLWLAPLDASLYASPHKVWLLRDAAFLVAYGVLVWVASRSPVPRGWIVFGGLVVLLPLASGSFTSAARFGLLALPAYWGLALVADRPRRHRLVVALAPILLVANVFTLPVQHP